MFLDLRKYELNKHYFFEEDIDFSSHVFAPTYRIRKIISCHVKIDLVAFEEVSDVKVEVSGEVIGACSYTNEDVKLPYKIKEDMTFSQSENRGADYYEPDLVFDLNPYIFALIDAAIPLNIHKKGAKMPSGGEGYEVLSEEDFLKKKKENAPSVWDALDDIDFDDEDK